MLKAFIIWGIACGVFTWVLSKLFSGRQSVDEATWEEMFND